MTQLCKEVHLMTKSKFILGAAPAVLLVLAGCSHTTREVVTPVPAATAPPSAAAPPTVIVANTPPPAPRDEVRPPAPNAGATWQDGYWTWNNGQYEWVPGHWVSTRAGIVRPSHRWESEGQAATPKGGPN
jgi:hypothetical protein